MINGLHHISLAPTDLEADIRAYRELLGREPTMRIMEDGVCCAYFRLENTALRIVTPTGDGFKAEQLRQKLEPTWARSSGLPSRSQMPIRWTVPKANIPMAGQSH
jgi:hypothetical protein